MVVFFHSYHGELADSDTPIVVKLFIFNFDFGCAKLTAVTNSNFETFLDFILDKAPTASFKTEDVGAILRLAT